MIESLVGPGAVVSCFTTNLLASNRNTVCPFNLVLKIFLDRIRANVRIIIVQNTKYQVALIYIISLSCLERASTALMHGFKRMCKSYMHVLYDMPQ
jgi:hypothetical protein